MASHHYPLCLLFLVVISMVDMTHSIFVCPSPCTCTDDHPTESNTDGFPKLVVDCRKQDLTTLPHLDGLTGQEIFKLLLDRNKLTELPSYAFRNLTVMGISLSDNPLVDISAQAFAWTVGIEYVSLRRTKLVTPPSMFTGPLTSLQVLDLSQIATATFSVITSTTFGPLPSLEQLLLQQNKMSSIEIGSFAELFPLLFELSLDANKLTEVPKGIGAVNGLISLSLDGNPIESIGSGALTGLDKLRTLTLTDTGLTSSANIDQNALSDVAGSLHKLDLSTNNLVEAPCQLLKGLTKLQELKMRDGMIKSIAPDCFSDLKMLRLLDISGNSIQVTAELLANIEGTIQVLFLERLGITLETLPTDSLHNMESLKELSLSGNNIPSLPDRAFDGLAMRKLTLSYCDLEAVAPTAFEGLNSPLSLDLNNNKIRNLTFLDNKCHFERIELYRNPVHCDCGFYHVVRYGIIDFVGVCATPTVYSGIDLNDFKSNQNVTSVCGTLSGVKDTILCYWQYMREPAEQSSSGASLLNISVICIMITHILFLISALEHKYLR